MKAKGQHTGDVWTLDKHLPRNQTDAFVAVTPTERALMKQQTASRCHWV
jgi:hypothetical protein